MGISLGDDITVNILGRDITAEVTGLREVDFSTAGIGFIMSMNPSALQGAPHSHIATVYAETEAEGAILRDVSNTYPNITAIRVRDAIDRVLQPEGVAVVIEAQHLCMRMRGAEKQNSHTTTSAMSGGGFMKCSPMTRSGELVAAVREGRIDIFGVKIESD